MMRVLVDRCRDTTSPAVALPCRELVSELLRFRYRDVEQPEGAGPAQSRQIPSAELTMCQRGKRSPENDVGQAVDRRAADAAPGVEASRITEHHAAVIYR